ncbi:MAG: hypothetical protein OXU81_09460 [Gammaproteobacteria bacterium]|nr:hypothetical protein [Gammaproteobacteria bacterium]
MTAITTIRALVCAGATRTQAQLASAAIASAADAWCYARGLPPREPRFACVLRVAELRNGDIATTLAAQGLSPERAGALAPRIARELDEAAPNLDPDAVWVTFNDVRGVPRAERAVLLQLGMLAIEVDTALRTPLSMPHARVHVEPLDRCPEGPWPGLLATHDLWLAAPGIEARGLLAEVRDRLVAHRPGVRAWPPASRTEDATVALRTPQGRPLLLVPFVVTDRATRAELDATTLPDAALPGLVHRPAARECAR